MNAARDRLWPCAPSDSSTLPSGVQVWAAWLGNKGEELAELWSTLSSDEQERARRFVFERDRTRFVAARRFLRAILGSCLGAEPHTIEIGYSAKGKPFLSGKWASSELQFNLAHSGNLALFAIARHGTVGVDVEQVRPLSDLSRLMQQSLSEHERAEIEKLPAEEQSAGFFRMWTRKEACLKATGQGIAELLKITEVCGPESEETLSGHQAAPQERCLRLHDLTPAPGFLGAIAVAS